MELSRDLRVIAPRTVAQAIAARIDCPESRFVAGGTDLVVNLRHGLGDPAALIDLADIDELHGIRIERGALRIGAGTTLAALEDSDLVRDTAPVILEAAAAVAGPTHRQAGTIGGNLCLDTRCVFYNQSEWWRRSNDYCLKHNGTVCRVAPTGTRCHAAFSGDLAPALIALGAEVDIAGSRGMRRISLADLYSDDGAAHLRLAAEELLVAVRVPAAERPFAAYRKARIRGAIDFPLAGVAVAVKCEGRALTALRVALTGTNSRPFLLAGTESLIGRPVDEAALATIGKLVQKQVSPMRTTVMPANHRRRVAAALATRLVRTLYAAAAA